MSYYYSPRKEQERNLLNNAVSKFLQNNSITKLQPQDSFEYHLHSELERLTYENIDDFKSNKRRASSIFDENDYEINSHLVGNVNELTANFIKPYQNPTPLAL